MSKLFSYFSLIQTHSFQGVKDGQKGSASGDDANVNVYVAEHKETYVIRFHDISCCSDSCYADDDDEPGPGPAFPPPPPPPGDGLGGSGSGSGSSGSAQNSVDSKNRM